MLMTYANPSLSPLEGCFRADIYDQCIVDRIQKHRIYIVASTYPYTSPLDTTHHGYYTVLLGSIAD